MVNKLGTFINSKAYNKFIIGLIILVLTMEIYFMFTETIYQSWSKIIFRTAIILFNLYVLNYQFSALKKKN